MSFYPADYLADTSHLRTVEHGAYFLLILHYWRTGGLPDDDDALARIVRATKVEWRRIRPVIQSFFHDGWKHKRIDHELAEAMRISEAGRRGGLASAQARRNRKSTIVERPLENRRNDPPTIQQRSDNQPQPQPQSQPESSLRSEARAKRATRLPEDWMPARDDQLFAIENGLSPERVNEELQKFRNYWLSKAGRDATKLDWSRTWQNWILNAKGPRNEQANRSYRTNSAAGHPQTGADAVVAGMGRVAARVRERQLAERQNVGDAAGGVGPDGIEASDGLPPCRSTREAC
jgi:uncharacterized protein YdaU (DUF1376 family)